jgi:hypothetical protein
VNIRGLTLAAGAIAAILIAAPGTAQAAANANGAASHVAPAPHVIPASKGISRISLKDSGTFAEGRSAGYAVPQAPPVTSTFSFENDGIAKFTATLTFQSRYTFTISNVRLSDTKADSRSVLALAEDNNFAYVKGTDPALYTWKNSSGAGHTISGTTFTFESTEEVQYVQIALYAANENGESSIVYSLKHGNPYY